MQKHLPQLLFAACKILCTFCLTPFSTHINCSLTIRTLFFELQRSGAEVVILFAVALNDPPANVWAFLITCAGQDRRRVCSSQCSGTIVCGPVLTSFGQSFHGEKHHHLRPERCPYQSSFSWRQAASTSRFL